MYALGKLISTVCLAALMLQSSASAAEGQALEKLLSNDVSGAAKDVNNLITQQQQPGGRLSSMLKDVLNVNVPNGSSLGINVLSGLVKVERGEEAERSGLIGNGMRRPLSVRVFGVPVFERGVRVRPLDSSSGPAPVNPNRGSAKPASQPDEIDLPLERR